MIEFQYFNGCPNSGESLKNLLEVQKELDINDNEIKIVEVPDIQSAERLNFQGSPTILINGIDIYTNEKPTGFSYTCRIYYFADSPTGIIPKKFIKEKIKQNLS